MNPLTIECEIHFDRRGRGARKELINAPAPKPPSAGRIPRVSRLMALAIKFDGLVRSGAVESFAELARLGHVTRARMSQIMNLLNLVPDIQESILFLPPVTEGRATIILADLQPIALTPDWRKQREMWKELVGSMPRRCTSPQNASRM